MIEAEGAGGATTRVRRSAPRQDWIFALALALFVGVLVWFFRAVHDFFGGGTADVLVPAYVGQTQSDALAECERTHLGCVVVATRSSDRFPKDVVMGQQPSAGTRVREGRRVSLVISAGVTIFPMPDLRFDSLRNAQLDLSHLKLQLGTTKTAANEDVPRDHVIAQDPPPLTSVREGAKVNLTLSKGPPDAIRVPNFANLGIDEARRLASDTKIHLGQIVWTPLGPHGPRRGEVVRQNPAPGTKIDPFELVSLQVSAGPTEFGYLVRQVHATATVPANDQSAEVRVEVQDETGTWNVYDGFAQGGQKLDFNLTVVGSAKLLTYVNNELLNQATIGKEPSPPRPAPGQGSNIPREESPQPKPSAGRR